MKKLILYLILAPFYTFCMSGELETNDLRKSSIIYDSDKTMKTSIDSSKDTILSDSLSDYIFYGPEDPYEYDYNYKEIFDAINDRDINKVDEFIKKGANLNIRDDKGNTPLLLAASNNLNSIVNLLLSRGVSPNVFDNKGWSPLNLAAYNKNYRMTESLLNKGADVNGVSVKGKSSLYWAAYRGDIDITKLLIAHGANIDWKSPTGQTALHAAIAAKHPEVVDFLIIQASKK